MLGSGFNVCAINSGNLMTLDDSSIRFNESTIYDWTEISLITESRIDAFDVTQFIDIDNAIFVHDRCVLNSATGTIFNNSIISGGGINNTIILQECVLFNNAMSAAVILVAGGYYYGRDNEFYDNYNGIVAYVNPDIFTRVEEHNSYFHDNIGTPIILD